MWSNKSLIVATLLVICVTMPAIVQAEATVTSQTVDYDPNEFSGKPTNPRFVCCRSHLRFQLFMFLVHLLLSFHSHAHILIPTRRRFSIYSHFRQHLSRGRQLYGYPR